MNLILLVFAPTILIFFASLTLIQFSVILHMLSIAAVKVRSIPTLQPFAPGITAFAQYHERVFGPLHKFTPQPTHVLLVALLIAVLFSLERRR